eukprot:1151953-Pelagomonas_calceolata.AAC.5
MAGKAEIITTFASVTQNLRLANMLSVALAKTWLRGSGSKGGGGKGDASFAAFVRLTSNFLHTWGRAPQQDISKSGNHQCIKQLPSSAS